MSLNELRPGEYAIVSDILCDDLLTRRLLSLGCIKGTQIQLKKVAPLGDPIVITLKGFNLAIRKKDASDIIVTVKKGA